LLKPNDEFHLMLSHRASAFFRICAKALANAALATCFVAALPAAASTTDGGISVLSYGADPTGRADSTSAFQLAANAAASAQATLRIPGGTYKVSQTIEIATSVSMDATSIVRATASMPAVLRIGSRGYVKDALFAGGKIDANNLAQDGIIFRQYQHLRVENTLVSNALVNGFHFGDSSLSSISYEAITNGLYTKRDSGILQAGSTGLFVDSNANDGNYAQSVFVGSDIGVKVLTGGNFFTDVHVWSTPSAGWMTVGFDDYATGNFWKGCEADSVKDIGLRARKYNTSIQGCRFYNNNTYSQDNVAVGIRFDSSAPGASILGSVFFGFDGSHRLAADIVGATSGLTATGNQSVNVVQMLNASTSVNGQLKVNGTLSASSYMYGRSFTAVPGTASSSTNATTALSLGASWYNSARGSSNSYSWNMSPSQSATGTPKTADLFLYTNGTLPSGVNPRFILGAGAATSAKPQVSSTQQVFQSSYFSGGASNYDSWGIQNVLGSGTAPSSTLAFTHWGSGGADAVSVPALILHGDIMNSAPRLTWSPYGNCPMTTLNCKESSNWKPSKGVTITQWTFSLTTAPRGCSYYPLLSLMKGNTVLVSVKLSSGVLDYSAGANLNFPVASSDGPVTIVVKAAGTGCSTNAAGMSSTVEYIMQ
jgi:hypothetical protein